MTVSFTDYHCHLIPAIDDGAADLREAIGMARVLCAFGFGTVYCTPHRITGCYHNEPERVVRATRTLQGILDQEGIPLRLVPGTEHYLDEYLMDQLPGALTIASSRHLLVEAPFRSERSFVAAMAAGLLQRDAVPLFAHPERCSPFDPSLPAAGLVSRLLGKKEPEMEGSFVLELRDAGCRFQGNLGSFAGYYGQEVKERALLFLRHGVYSCVGSDAHRVERLSDLLKSGYAAMKATVGELEANRLLSGALPGSDAKT